jgi:flagellar basal body P-ring formation protein FlgA
VSLQVPQVCLGEVADIIGTDTGQIAMLASVALGTAPKLGVTMRLNHNQIRELIRAELGSDLSVTFSGAPIVNIQLRGRPVNPEELTTLIKNYLSETTPWQDAQIDVELLGSASGLELPPGEVTLRVMQKTSFASYKNTLVPIESILDGKPYGIFWVTANISIRVNVVQAARKIPFGAAISRDDVRETLSEINDPRSVYVRNCKDIIGKIARRTLMPGESLTRELLADPVLVRNGETVHLRFQKNGITVVALARAEQNGKLGQIIRVRNLDFLNTLKAQVVGRGEVRVE